MLQDIQDKYFMQMALREAELAFEKDEVPVGAVIAGAGQPIAKGHNQVEMLIDVTAHAEMIAITAAAAYIGGKYLPDCTLYVTLEPCLMCASALNWAHIGRIVYGASDPKKGFHTFGGQILHPKTELVGGVMEAECSELLKQFFEGKREG